VFKTRQFARWSRKVGLNDDVLWEAIGEMAAGLIDADLGGGLLKKRIRLPGRGKRGGARTIVATNRGNLWVFILGFAKNERENVDQLELGSLLAQAARVLRLSTSEIEHQIRMGKLQEICRG